MATIGDGTRSASGERQAEPSSGPSPERAFVAKVQSTAGWTFLIATLIGGPFFLIRFQGGTDGAVLVVLAVLGYSASLGLTTKGRLPEGAIGLIATATATTWAAVLLQSAVENRPAMAAITLLPVALAAGLGRFVWAWGVATLNVGALVWLLATSPDSELAYTIVIFTTLSLAVLLSVAGALRQHERQRATQVEQHLAKRNNDIEILMDNLDEMVWTLDRTGRVLAFNRPAVETFRAAFGYTMQPGDDWLQTVPPEHRERARRSLSRVLDGETFTVERTFNIQGQERRIDVHYAPLRDPSGQITGCLCNAVDRTDATARQELEVRAAALEEEIGAAKEAQASQMVLWSAATHELKNPLTPLRLQLHVFRNKFGDQLTEDQLRSLEIMARSVDRMTLLASDILDLAKLQTGQFNLNPEKTGMADVIGSEVEVAGHTAKQHGIRFEVECADNPMVRMDGARIGQVLANFIGNAIKFSPDLSTIRVSCQAKSGRVRVAVKDEGIGLTGEGRNALFRPFSQANQPGEGRQAGTGLGLYICRGIIEAHGGDIGADSVGQGQGSTFWFELPVQTPRRGRAD